MTSLIGYNPAGFLCVSFSLSIEPDKHEEEDEDEEELCHWHKNEFFRVAVVLEIPLKNSFKIRLEALRQRKEQEREQFSLIASIYFCFSRCYFAEWNGGEYK